MPTEFKRAEDAAYAVVAFVIIILNITEIVLILRVKFKKIFDRLLLSLAVSDFIVGLAIAAYKLIDLNFGEKLVWFEEDKFANVFLFSLNFSIWNLFVITIDRYFAVKFPIKHRVYATERRCNIVIGIMWLVSLIILTFHVLNVFLWDEESDYFLLLSSVTVLVFGGFMIAVYSSILYLLSKNRIKTSTENKEGRTRRQKLNLFFNSSKRAERAVCLSSFFVAVSFMLFTYPFAIEYLVIKSGKDISFITKLFILLNSLFNPFIYFFKSYFCPMHSRRRPEAVEVN